MKRVHTHRVARGMTLVEVLAVVVILGLLAGTLAVGFSGAFSKGKHELARTGIGVIAQRLELYQIAHDSYPSSEIGLAALSDGYAKPTDEYYLAPDRLLDPWGERYLLIVPGPDGHPYEIITYGSDRQPGGTGSGADISSINIRGQE